MGGGRTVGGGMMEAPKDVEEEAPMEEEEAEAEETEVEDDDDDEFKWFDDDGPHPDEIADQQRALVVIRGDLRSPPHHEHIAKYGGSGRHHGGSRTQGRGRGSMEENVEDKETRQEDRLPHRHYAEDDGLPPYPAGPIALPVLARRPKEHQI
ncbi:hypothetical protein QYE76_041004 [Lolium multiflorum]|uniref:Uncharacterized protein n=1 Tax=Lolium multiflorum TaxID=4521 RepID=A0AAD8TEG9_LOLMU|nr:hypothetical protein QYE76_041004 [Lolium multiflorum]